MSKELSKIVKTGIKELNKKIDNLPQGEDSPQQDLTPLQNKIGEVELQSNSNLEKIETIQEDVRKAKNDITNIDYSITTLSESIDTLKTKTTTFGGNLENINNSITSHGNSITEIKTTIHNINGSIENLDNEFNAHSTSLTEINTDINTLKNKANNIDTKVSKSGDTVTGPFILNGTSDLAKVYGNGGAIAIYGGSGTNLGARMVVRGKENTGVGKGTFDMEANDGTNKKILRGEPNGKLTWDNVDIITKTALIEELAKLEARIAALENKN